MDFFPVTAAEMKHVSDNSRYDELAEMIQNAAKKGKYWIEVPFVKFAQNADALRDAGFEVTDDNDYAVDPVMTIGWTD